MDAATVDRLRRYAKSFDAQEAPLFGYFSGDPKEGNERVFPFEPGSDKGLGVLLLFAALYRPGTEVPTARLIAELYRHFQNDIFRLNRIPFDSLNQVVENVTGKTFNSSGQTQEEVARIPGILRSVCDFFYRIGPLGAWLAQAADWETRVMELCGEIYWMGRHSLMKNKARYFLGLAAATGAYPQALNFAWPVGEGHLRYYSDLVYSHKASGGARGPGAFGAKPSTGFDGARRLQAFQLLARAVFPEAPWKLFAPLDAYQRRGGSLHFRCREAQGGCRPCPLASTCSAAPAFLPQEEKADRA